MKVFIDSDILIWHFRRNQNAFNFLQQLSNTKQNELWIGAMQRAEILFFMRPNKEKSTLLFLSQFQTAIVDQSMIDLASRFYRQWNPSHGTDENNAILAANTVLHDGHLFTQNIKHYPMPEVKDHKGWD